MAVVTSDLVKLVTAGVKTDFMAAYKRMADLSVVPQIASIFETTLPTQNYAWMSANPKMKQWLDERTLKALTENSYTITDKKWEATLAIERTALEDDQYGAIRARTQSLAEEAARHKEQLVVEQYALAATTAGPDGQYMVDTDHAESGSNQSNKSTSALSEATLTSAISDMGQFVDDQGVPMGIRPTHLLVGPKLQFTARKLLESTTNVITRGITASSSELVLGDKNVLEGMLNLVVSPYLTGTYDDYWFVIDASRAVKPVILQVRSDVPVEFAALDDPNTNEAAFMRDLFLYGVRARYNVGYGLWQMVFGGIL